MGNSKEVKSRKASRYAEGKRQKKGVRDGVSLIITQM
ncbi:MAG: hypothetical protein QOJ76_1372, partial [Acidobacteriota bacterium]|nr:hypothetical protein [Acidobacteriota bacterium]